MKPRRPYMRWFPSDWRAEPKLRLCSRAARSLWADMLGLMHEATPYGHLVIDGVAATPRQIALILGDSEDDVRAWLAELETAAVFSRTPEGTVFCRRMVRDHERDLADAENGKRGGRPREIEREVAPLDAVAHAAEQRIKAAERQRRWREKQRDMSRLSTVTDVTRDVTVTRDSVTEKRDSAGSEPCPPKAAAPVTRNNPPPTPHSHSHSHRKPLPETPEPRAGGPASPVTGAGPPGPRGRKRGDDRTPEQRAADRAAARAAADEAFGRKPGETIQ